MGFFSYILCILALYETAKLFSKRAVPFYICTNNENCWKENSTFSKSLKALIAFFFFKLIILIGTLHSQYSFFPELHNCRFRDVVDVGMDSKENAMGNGVTFSTTFF